MKKFLVFGMIFCMLAMTGCDSGMERIFYPGGNDAELYYDSYLDVRTRIKREDVKRSSQYSDLFLADGIKAGMDLSEALYTDNREALLDISTAEEVFFIPKATGATELAQWINECTLKYTFDKDEIISTYEIINSRDNTYIEYLYVMRALSLKYGECTTEIYKNEDNIINNAKIKEDYKTTEEIIAFFESEFATGNVGILSQWVNDDCIITVDFTSPELCSITYEIVEWQDSDKTESEEE